MQSSLLSFITVFDKQMLRLTGRKHLHLIYEHLWDGFKLNPNCGSVVHRRTKAGESLACQGCFGPPRILKTSHHTGTHTLHTGQTGAWLVLWMVEGSRCVCLIGQSDRRVTGVWQPGATSVLSGPRPSSSIHSFIHFTLTHRLSDVTERERERERECQTARQASETPR